MSTQAAAEKLPTFGERFSAVLRRLAPKLKEFAVNILAQVRVWRKAYPGIMHAMIFWGVTIQVVGTAINLMQMQLFIPFVELPFPRENGYLFYELIMDLAGLAILLGVGMAAFRRLVLRPKTLESRGEDVYALVLLALIPLVGFTVEGLRLLTVSPDWARWSPIGNLFSGMFRAFGVTPEAAFSVHPYLFWTHVALGLTLVASIPFTKLRHLVQTPLHILLRPGRKSSVLEKIENIEETEVLGVGSVAEFTPVQLLSFDACLRCGRCEEACPSVLCGAEYSPKNLIQSLRQIRIETLERPNGNGKHTIPEALPEHMLWSCTTCGACQAVCPAFINPVDEVIDLRRYQTLTTGKIPKSVADTLRNLERSGNPWGMDPGEKAGWLDGLGVRQLQPGDQTDVLLFLGCALSYDDNNKKVTQSFVNLLNQAGVDFGVLGLDEMCCGDTARRLGHEYIFQMMAEENIANFAKVKFNRVVTQCPHCFNTLKNEYPQFGGDFKVQHYTEFLAELTLPLKAAGGNGAAPKITYHDPCYLGRHNQVIEQPRQLFASGGVELLEMARRKQDSLCCGGGGGQMWMETDADKRINHLRLQDALDTGAEVIATACPYCLLMFDDAIRSKGLGERVQVKDITQIFQPALMAEKEAAHG